MHTKQMHAEEKQQDAAWELLKKARPVEVEPCFARETRRIAAATPQGLPGRILAWFGIAGRPTASDPGSASFTGGRFALAGIALGVLTAAAVAITLLGPDRGSETRFAHGAGTAPVSDAPEAGNPSGPELDELAGDLAEIPEVASLEREFDEIGDLLQLASTLDVDSLADDEIEALLF